ncbi:helix-turn-helix domain-containing protein [Roseateles sp. P5_E7]
MYETLSFCSAVLGLFLAVPLLALLRRRAANAWIGLFVLSISLLSLSGTRWYHAHPEWFGLMDWPVTTLGAFYLCYMRAMVGLGNDGRQAWHFLPLAAFIGLLLRAKFFQPVDFGLFFLACEALATAYAVAAGWHLHRASSLPRRDRVWLGALSVVVVLILLNCVLSSLFGGLWDWGLLVHRVVILYFVGWFGLRQVEVFLPERGTADAPPPQLAAEADTGKYARSGMTDAAQALIGAKLQQRMAQARDFLENELTLADLAERIGTSPQLLSQYLNDTLGLSFFDYINGLRVAEVQRMMADPAQASATLLDLAYAAGFNAKSTFNAAFKKISGATPSEWRRLQARTSEPIR